MTDQTEENRKIAIEFLSAIGAGRLDIMDRLMSADATWWVLGWGKMSRDQMLHEIAKVIQSTTSRSFTITRTTAQGDKVSVEANSHFDFPGIDPYRNEYHFLITIRKGQVVGGREYLDTLVMSRTMQQQMAAAQA